VRIVGLAVFYAVRVVWKKVQNYVFPELLVNQSFCYMSLVFVYFIRKTYKNPLEYIWPLRKRLLGVANFGKVKLEPERDKWCKQAVITATYSRCKFPPQITFSSFISLFLALLFSCYFYTSRAKLVFTCFSFLCDSFGKLRLQLELASHINRNPND
jgi:hypothetical protein